jgi:hypothetical protein
LDREILGIFSGRIIMMKSLHQRIIAVSIVRLLLLGPVVLLMLPQSLLADEFTNISDVRDCRAIAAKAERLLCYDTITDGGVFKEQQVQQVQKEKFGSKEEPPDVSIDRLAVSIVRVKKSATGVHYFYTADGAIWAQSNSRKWSLKAPFQAKINKGVMGSFFLVSEGGKSVRVKRVQ